MQLMQKMNLLTYVNRSGNGKLSGRETHLGYVTISLQVQIINFPNTSIILNRRSR